MEFRGRSHAAAITVLVLAAAIVALLAAPTAAVAVPSTQAYASPSCVSSPCIWSDSDGQFDAGGQGMSLVDLVTGVWHPTTQIQQKVLTILSVAAGVIPRYETVPAIQNITLGSGPLSLGWKIGSTQNTKWFHLLGTALDRSNVSAAVSMVTLTFLREDLPYRSAGATACYVNSNGTCGPRLPTGWYLGGSDSACSVSGSPMVAAYNIPSGFTQSCWGQASLDAVSKLGVPLTQIDAGYVNQACCTIRWPSHEWIVSVPTMYSVLVIDQPLQPYTNQHVDITTGWPVPGGCGDVSTACGYPGSTTNPSISQQKIICQLTGEAPDCGTSVPNECVPSDGSGFFGGAGSTGCGLGVGPWNDVNCHLDPWDYDCPTTSPDGRNYSGHGGPGIPPANVDAPKVKGKFDVGEVLTADLGNWTGADTVAAEWYRCSATACADTGQSASTFTTTQADEGQSFEIRATASNRHGSTTVFSAATPALISQGDLDQMAREYRPALLFDSSEHYRPITLDSLLAEDVHKACNHTDYDPCYSQPPTVGTVQQLVDAGGSNPYLSIWQSPDTGEYESPSCDQSSFMYDCGDHPGIYYDFGQSATGYRFLDYWFFYRYNPPTYSYDAHEGDWEGVTLELSPAPGTLQPAIAGAILWAHGTGVFRLPGLLHTCYDGAASGVDCPTNTTSTHIATYVARGSHASYEAPCSSNCYNPRLGLDVEQPHDGAAGWSDNLDSACQADSCVNAMTSLASTDVPAWVSWAGQWGGSGSSPEGPRWQVPYQCTQDGWDVCGYTPQGNSMPVYRRVLATGASASRDSSFGVCANWFDGGLAAFSCSQSSLSDATATHQIVATPGSLSLAVPHRRTATAPGLVQVGGGPLRGRVVVRVAGVPAPDQVIGLNYTVGKRTWFVSLKGLRVRGGASVALTPLGGKPTVRLDRLSARSIVVRPTAG